MDIDEQQRLTITDVAVMGGDIKYIKAEISEIKNLLKDKYVTVEAFDPVKKIVYGLVGVTLISIVGAIITMVIK